MQFCLGKLEKFEKYLGIFRVTGEGEEEEEQAITNIFITCYSWYGQGTYSHQLR